MLDLFLNIVFGSAFVLCIKWAQRLKTADALVAGPLNYIVAAILIIPNAIQADYHPVPYWAIGLGALMGICYFIAYFFVDISIRWVGAAATTAVTVLAIVFPILCGIFIWNDQPSSWQVVGIVLAMVSLGIIGGSKKQKPTAESEAKEIPVETTETFSSNNTKWQLAPASKFWAIPAILITFFVLAGLARLAQEAFKRQCVEDQKDIYLLSAFLLASIPSAIFLLIRKKRVTWVDFGIGFLMGSSNLLQTFFILRALVYFPGFIVFPVSSAGSLILITLVATFLLGEKINGRTIAGITGAIVALTLLNWPAG